MLLFKYLSPEGALKVFEREDELAIRFGLPRDYNDPYELFLQAQPPLESDEVRAFYDLFLGEVAQIPVTCFSKRPDSVVMWSHYGRDGKGVCIGFDEDALARQFSLCFIHDIEYKDEPATIESSIVNFVFATGKRRHALRMLSIANRAAYFVKRGDWRYESERRLVVTTNAVEDHHGLRVARILPQALRYLILGARADASVRTIFETRAAQYDIPLLDLKIGKRTYQPFFVGAGETAATWSGTTFEPLENVCEGCSEPILDSVFGLCEWCSISDELRQLAGIANLLGVTLSHGIEEDLPLEFDGLLPRGRLVKGTENG